MLGLRQEAGVWYLELPHLSLLEVFYTTIAVIEEMKR